MTHGRAQLQNVEDWWPAGTARCCLPPRGSAGLTALTPRSGRSLPDLTKKMSPGTYDILRAGVAFRLVVTNTTPMGAYRAPGDPRPRPRSSGPWTCSQSRSAWTRPKSAGRTWSSPTCSRSPPPPGRPTTSATTTRRWTLSWRRRLRRSCEPSRPAAGTRRVVQLGLGLSATSRSPTAGGRQTARVEFLPTGTASVQTGSSPHGQGHVTAWSMLVGPSSGIPIDDDQVVPDRHGLWSPRATARSAPAPCRPVASPCTRPRCMSDQARYAGGGHARSRPRTPGLDTAAGPCPVAGTQRPRWAWARVAERPSRTACWSRPTSAPGAPTFPFGAHLAVVEVDTETGKVTCSRHWSWTMPADPQSFAGRRAAAWRVGSGRRPGSAGRVPLRRRRQPAHYQPGGLRLDLRGRAPEFRAAAMETPTPGTLSGPKVSGSPAPSVRPRRSRTP